MAGAGTSWLDVALYLIARSAGVDAAMQVARINLIDWHDVGQQPFARLARSRRVDDGLVARCQAWIAEYYDEPSPVASMVRLSGIAERSFKRRFREATGMAPLEYVHTLCGRIHGRNYRASKPSETFVRYIRTTSYCSCV